MYSLVRRKIIFEDGQYQTVEGHLKNVGELSARYSKEFGAQQFGYICGMLHDVGKYSIEFQNRLLKGG